MKSDRISFTCLCHFLSKHETRGGCSGPSSSNINVARGKKRKTGIERWRVVNTGLFPHHWRPVGKIRGEHRLRAKDLRETQRCSCSLYPDQASAVRLSWMFWRSHRAEVNHNLIQSHAAAQRDSGDICCIVQPSCCVSAVSSLSQNTTDHQPKSFFSAEL